jgi:dTDP-glucose 4,6-dehydratase
LPTDDREAFRFLQVSTDEVYGQLSADAAPVTEETAYSPSSPYAASKAAADHLVHAYHRTYGFPTLIAHCCNNYGPFQYPEKLIPRMITCALRGTQLPVYGDGEQLRDWLYVDDTCFALRCILESGSAGEAYNIAGKCELSNATVVDRICSVLDRVRPRRNGSYRDLIRFVADRPGHDRRYAMDGGKLSSISDWRSQVPFEDGLERTIWWYLNNVEPDVSR